MAKTIPQLTDATTVNAADELIIQQGGITKRATGAELAKGLNTINGTVNVKDFGAVGDGVEDDTAAFAAALVAANGGILDGSGLTYKINSPIVCPSQNILVQNMTLDFSGVADQPGSPDTIFTFAGTQGTDAPLSASTLVKTNVVTVANTAGFVEDGYAWLSSNALFSTAQNVVLGQIVKIKQVTLTTITLYNDVLYDFLTTQDAAIAPLNTKNNIRIKNVKFIGSGSNVQSVLNFNRCADIEVTGCTFEYCDYVACRIERCVNFMADNCTIRYARAVGFSYGFAVHRGSYSVKIINSYGEDLRHFVTVGAANGVNLFVQVANNHVNACKDAGIDSHAACDFMVIDGNTIDGSHFDSGQLDGIVFQGLNAVISNNYVVGAKRHSIIHSMFSNIGSGGSVITGNNIQAGVGTPATDAGIYVLNNGGGAVMDGVIIADNRLVGTLDIGVRIRAFTGDINGVSISGNITTNPVTANAILVRADDGHAVRDFSIANNVIRGGDAASTIYCLGDGSLNIVNGNITGNTILGGANGIRLLQSQNVVESGNYNAATTRKVFLDAGTSNVWMDRRFYPPVTVTNSTYTVTAENSHIVCNRAATVTLTLPAASASTGRELSIKTIQAQTVVSASSNVAPINDSTVGTAILPATDGAWALLRSDGTNWIIMQRG